MRGLFSCPLQLTLKFVTQGRSHTHNCTDFGYPPAKRGGSRISLIAIARAFARAVREPPLQRAHRGTRGPLWQHQFRDRGLAQTAGFWRPRLPEGTLPWHGIVAGMVSGSMLFCNLDELSGQVPKLPSEGRSLPGPSRVDFTRMFHIFPFPFPVRHASLPMHLHKSCSFNLL